MHQHRRREAAIDHVAGGAPPTAVDAVARPAELVEADHDRRHETAQSGRRRRRMDVADVEVGIGHDARDVEHRLNHVLMLTGDHDDRLEVLRRTQGNDHRQHLDRLGSSTDHAQHGQLGHASSLAPVRSDGRRRAVGAGTHANRSSTTDAR